jgi:hypothetical protein
VVEQQRRYCAIDARSICGGGAGQELRFSRRSDETYIGYGQGA